MSYDSIDRSIQDGTPIELYQFLIGSTERVLFTSAAKPVVFDGFTYRPVHTSRGNVMQNQDVNRNSVSFDFPRTNDFALRLLVRSPDLVITATVFRMHRGESGSEVIFKGRVIGARATDSIITVEAESIFTSIKRAGLRATYQTTCRHALYSLGCQVNRASYRVSTTAVSVSGPVVVVASLGGREAGHYLAGILKHGPVERQITAVSNTAITMSDTIYDLVPGGEVEIYPGCDLTFDTCNARFGNVANFGGFLHIPWKNPFRTIIY